MHKDSTGNNPDLTNMVLARRAFEMLKTTKEFKKWKREQLYIQGYKCAWCRQKINKGEITHTDHCLPLYHGGTNSYNNLVVSHVSCNLEKWIRIDGMPEWVKQAKAKHIAKQKLRKIRVIQNYQMKEIISDILDDDFNTWFKTWA